MIPQTWQHSIRTLQWAKHAVHKQIEPTRKRGGGNNRKDKSQKTQVVTRIIAYSLRAISNRSVTMQHKTDKKQVHSLLAKLIYNFLMVTSWGSSLQLLHLQLWAHTHNCLATRFHKGTDIYMCCMCSCAPSVITQAAEGGNYFVLVTC